jgi:hypothetical protein
MEAIPKASSFKSIPPAIKRIKTVSGRKLRAMDSAMMGTMPNEQDQKDIIEETLMKAQKVVMEQKRKEQERRQQLEGLVPQRQTMMGKVSSLFRPNRIQPERAREVESNLSNALPKDIQNLLEMPYEDLMSDSDDKMDVFKADQAMREANNPIMNDAPINTKGFSMMK